jgi:ligand-binding sensor domain-containing protein/DNA-binding CsgD family transcriptional regulator
MNTIKMPIKKIVLTFLCLLSLAKGQTILAQMSDNSYPFISNYSPKTHGMHPRNFAAVQGLDGVMYFANAYGVLMYDGNFWKPIGLPDGISAYSLAVNTQGTIYVGSVGEFGYLAPDGQGNLFYKSMSQQTNVDSKTIGNVNNIHISNDSIYFVSEKIIFAQFPHQPIQILCKTQNAIQFSALIQHKLYVQTTGDTLSILNKKSLQPIIATGIIKDKPIKGIITDHQQELWLATDKALYHLKNHTLQLLKSSLTANLFKSNITTIINLPKNEIGVATSGNGLLIFNQQGILTKHINSSKGLRKNNVNNLFIDKNDGLWLVLDNGLAYTDISSPYSFVNESAGIQGMGYKCLIYNAIIYAATDQGLFYKPITAAKSAKFQQMQGIEGMVRDIVIANGTLLCTQLNSVYEINGMNAHLVKKIDQNSGPWTIKTFTNQQYALVGLYDGLAILKYSQNHWVYSHRIQGFDESSRVFEIDSHGNIWVCHGNKGLYRITLNATLSKVIQVKEFSKANGYKKDYFNHISYLDHELCITTSDGIYKFNEKNEQFEVNKTISAIVGYKKYTDRLVQTDPNNTWIFQDGSMLQLRKVNQQYQLKSHHKLRGDFIGSYEFIGNLNATQFVIGSQDGFILLQKELLNKQKFDYKPLIRRVEIIGPNNKILFGGTHSNASGLYANHQNNIPHLAYTDNSLNISFSYPNFDSMDKIKYQYAITNNNVDSNLIRWSNWEMLTQIEYPQLPEGDYTFLVRAKNAEGSISQVSNYRFAISPPWYRSLIAYLLYSAVLIIVLWLTTLWVLKRFKLQQERLENRKKEELALLAQKFIAEQLLQEKELVELKNKQLETQVLLKKNELATVATNLNQKKEFLSQVKKNITVAAEDLEASESKLFKQIIKKIDSDLDLNDNWEIFQLHFDEANNNYLKRLHNKYPKLTPSWLLLCAYIKLNKSNKEMAALLNISLSAVEKRRYRLKDKLNLESDGKLTDYLINF